MFQSIFDQEAEGTSVGLIRQAHTISLVLSIFVLVEALLVLVVGWGAGVEVLVRTRSGLPAMVPGTAFLFVLSSLILIAIVLSGKRFLAILAGGVLLVFSASEIEPYLASVHMLKTDGMSVMTGLEFMLVSLCLIALGIPGNVGAWLSQALATVGLISIQAILISYLFDTSIIFESQLLSKLSLNTAISFALLLTAFLFATRQPGWIHLTVSHGFGSSLLRLLLPTALCGPVAMGVLVSHLGELGFDSEDFKIALLVLTSCWVVSVGLFIMAGWLNRSAAAEKAALLRLHQKNLDLSQAEALAARSHKVASLGRVAGGVAHDFNNLLTVIQGNLELICEASDPADRKAFVQDALEATQRGANLTQKLLSFGEKSVLHPEILMIDRKIRFLEGMLRQYVPEAINLVISLGADGCRIRADRAQLEQAILNLVTNAAEAIEGRGRIVVETGHVTLGDEKSIGSPSRTVPEGPYLFVKISDTGQGLSPDLVDKVTDPFFTTKTERLASGLGLSMVKGFCQQSGGFLDIDSQPGQGASFIMYFPVAATTLEVVASTPNDLARTGRGVSANRGRNSVTVRGASPLYDGQDEQNPQANLRVLSKP